MRILLAALVLLASITARAQWTLQDSHTTADLRGIVNAGGGIAWASGTNGTVLRTTDGGATWQICAIPPGAEKLDFRGIQAFDANTAIVMSSGPGDQSRLYKTTDGCQTWTLLLTNTHPQGFWDAISFRRNADGKIHGWLLGDPVHNRFEIAQSTSDDGLDFRADDTPTLAADPKTEGAFAASNSAFFELLDGPILPSGPPLPPPPQGTRRTNHYDLARQPIQWFVTGGKQGARIFVRQPDRMFDFSVKPEWIAHSLPLGSNTESSGAFAVNVRSLDSGVIVGGDYLKPNDNRRTAVYRDAKSHEWLAATTPPHGYRSAVAYDAPTKTWITVGPNGTDISTDDGRNWRPLHPTNNDPPDADRNWNALSLPYAVGPHGRIGILKPSALQPSPAK